MIQQTNISCLDNQTLDECSNDTSNFLALESLFLVIDITMIAQNMLLLFFVSKMVTISKSCCWIWYNELAVNIGIYLIYFGWDIAVFFVKPKWNIIASSVLLIMFSTCAFMCTHMLAANMYNVQLAFQVGFDYNSLSETKIRIFLLGSWVFNLLVSCLILIDGSLLTPSHTFMAEFAANKTNLWIISVQFLNLIIYPTAFLLFSFIRIMKLKTCERAVSHTLRAGFQAGYRLATLLIALYLIQIAALAPYFIFVYFGQVLKTFFSPNSWFIFELVVTLMAVGFSILKLPIFLARNRELRALFRCKKCHMPNTVGPM